MSSVTEKYGKNLLNPLATNMNSADYKINELNNAINKFQKNASVTNDAAIIADLSVDVANKLENAKNYISDDVYKNIQNQLISYRSASNQQRINQEIRQNLIAKNKTNRASSSDIAKRKMILDDATALDLLELQQKQLRGVNVDSLVLSDMQKHLLGQETSESIYTQSNILENIANVAETPEQKAVREKYGLNDNITSKEIDELLIDVNRKIGDYDRMKGGMTLNEYEQNEYDNLINKRKELSNYKNEYLLPKEKSSEKLAEKKNAINTAKHDLIGLSFNERLELYNEAIANGDNEYAEYIKEHKYDDLSSYYDFVLALKYLKKDYQDLVVESLTGKIPESLIQKYVNEIERTGKLSHFEVDLNDVVTDSNSNDEFRSQISQKFQDIEDKIDKLERNEYYYAKHEYELKKLGIHGEEYVELIKENEDATSFGGRWDSKDKIKEIEKEWISRGIMTQDEIDDLKQYIKGQYQKEKNMAEMKELYSDVTEYNDLQEVGMTLWSAPVAFGGNVLTLFDSIYQAGRELFGGEKRPINAYSDINASAQWAKTVREAVQADQSDAGKFFYGVGCSLLDMGTAIAASGGIGDSLAKSVTGKAVAGSLTKNVTLASMSLNAGGGAALDAMEKTSNPYEVAAIGVSSAVFEALAEKLPLDNLFKIAGQEGKITTSMILKAMGSQAVSEFGEEAATETANIIMEAIVLSDKSDWAQTVQDYIDKGYSESEARSKALVSMVGRVGMSGLAGAISGGFSGGGASTINYLAYNYSLNSTGKTLIKNNQVERLIELAETAGVDISAYNLEGKKGNYNASAIGELYFEVMRNKSDAVSNALKEMGVSEADVAVVQNAIFREAFGQNLSTEMQTKYNQYEDIIDNAMNDKTSSLNVAANDYMLTSLLVEIPRSNASNTATDVSGTDSANADFDTNIDTDIDTEVNVESSNDIDATTESEIAEADYLDNETLESVEENEYDKTIRLMDGRAKPLTEAQAYVQSVGRALGYTVVIDDLSRGGRTASGKSFKGTTRGFFDGQTIYLHEGQTTFDAVVEIFKHEITHYSELNPEMYEKYAKAVFGSKAFEKWISGKGGFDQYSQSIIDKYKKHGVSLETEKKTDSPTKVEREIIAYFTSEMLFNEKGNTLERFINEVNSEDRNAISRFIHDLISWLKTRLKGEKASFEITRLENRFAAVLRNVDNTNAQKNNTTNDGDVQYDGEGNSYSFGDIERYAEYDKPITPDDIRLLRKIGRKSINEFTPREIEIAQKWAYKFYQQLGTKSPFFRRWFGDWRACDISPANIVSFAYAENPKLNYAKRYISCKELKTRILVDETVINDSLHYAKENGDEKQIRKLLGKIDGIVENGILLDTQISTHSSGNKKGSTQFMHYLYTPISVNGAPFIAKLSIEEYDLTGKKRAYNIQRIELSEVSRAQYSQLIEENRGKFAYTSDALSVAQLFNLVKTYDTEFEPTPVNAALINEADGTPKVFYHGTNAQFTEFDKKKSKPGFYGRGFYFTTEKSQANVYGNEMPVYLNIKNPLMPGKTHITETQIANFLDAVAENEDYSIENYGTYNVSEIMRSIESRDAFDVIQDINATAIGDFGEAMQLFNEVNGTSFDGVITSTETVVYERNQIKSAADGGNIGTFSEAENDIQYSFEITPEQDAEYIDAVNNGDMETAQRMVDEAAERAMLNSKIRDEDGKLIKVYHGSESDFTVFDKTKGRVSMDIQGMFFSPWELDAAGYGSNVRAFYLNIKNPANESTGYKALRQYQKKNYAGVKAREHLERIGYDGVNNENEEYIAFNSSQIKSADAITYDDNGNIIPLSERFNEDDNDIRYSFEDDVADEVSSLTEQYKNGEISYDEWKSQAASLIGDNNTNKADNPVSIANLSVEAANPTPDLPKRNRANKKGDGDSKLAESIQKSDIFSKEFKDEVVDDDFIKHYDRATNKETMAKAKKLLDEGGSSFVLQWFNKSIDETSTVDVAVGVIMLDRYQKIGDMANALEIAYKLREMATISGQTVQIFSILGRFTPEMMLVYTQHELDKAYETIIKGKTNKWIESNRSKFELTEAEKEFIIRNTLVASTLPEGRDKQIKLAEIATLVQKKIPHKPGDAYKALQRICMLLNPKTNVRNIVGNAIMTPICWIDDLWGACIDNLASKKSGVRTTGNFQFGKETAKAFAQGVYESYDDFIRDINTREINLENSSLGSGNNFNENHTGKVSKYINPISKSLNALDRITSFILDAGDRGFFQMWFINSLNNQLRLNNTTEPTAEMIEIATNDALERTWQDSDNKIVQAFSGMRGALNHLNIHGVGLGDLFIKFIKTPSNLLRASIKYSPAGFVKATSDYIKFNRSLKNGQFDAKLQRKFVNNLSKSITGTLLYVVFGFLAHAGVISGGADDDKDVAAFEKNILGIQPYSVKIGDYSFSYEWAQPIASGMAFMADLMNIWESDSRTEAEADLENALLHGSQTILNLSVFQSFQNIFKEEDLISTIINGIVNEVVVFSPQALSQVASVTDDYSRETYEKDNKIQTVINSVKKKIPGLRNTLPESVDVYGEAVENPYDNVWDAFFNPANQLQSNSSPSAEKIYELYQNTKDKSVIPPKAVNGITINGEDITFTSEERTAFQKYRGQLNAKYLDDFTSSSLWEKSSDEEKISIIKDIYSFTNSLAKNHYSSEYELSKKEQKILEYEDFGIMSPIEYFSITTTADKDGNSHVSKSEYAEAVNNTDMSQKQKDLLIGLNEVEGKSDYSKNKTKGFGAGDWYYKENGQYVKITSAAELNRLRRNNVDTYVYTGNYTDVIDELWRAYRG